MQHRLGDIWAQKPSTWCRNQNAQWRPSREPSTTTLLIPQIATPTRHPLLGIKKKKKKNQLIAPPTSQPLPQPLSLALCGQLERFDAASGHFACHLLILLYAFHFPNCGHNFVAHGLPFVVNGSAWFALRVCQSKIAIKFWHLLCYL